MSERQNYCTVSIKGKLMAGEHLINILLHLRCLKCSLWKSSKSQRRKEWRRTAPSSLKLLLPLPSPKRPPRNRQQLPLPAVLRFEVKHTDRPDIDPSIDLCGILGFKWSFFVFFTQKTTWGEVNSNAKNQMHLKRSPPLTARGISFTWTRESLFADSGSLAFFCC